MEYLIDCISEYEWDDEYHFINIPNKYHIDVESSYILNRNSQVTDNVVGMDNLRTTGTWDEVNRTIVLESGQVQYGPYITLAPGVYNVKITGDNLENAEVGFVNNIGDMSSFIELLSKDTECIEYRFVLYREVTKAEFTVLNQSEKVMTIESLEIKADNIVPAY